MFLHETVMREEAVAGLQVRPDGIYVDATLGGGGHSDLIASRLSERGRLIGFDQDETAIRAAKERLVSHGDKVMIVKSNFRNMKGILADYGIREVDGVLFDLGVSSPQLDEEERGFSYNGAALLDMRMDREQPLSAYEVVNRYPEEKLAEIIFRYGEEKFARRIAREIVAARERKPVETTAELVAIIKRAIPAPARRKGPHPAKRTFQAIRIEVNDELNAFATALTDAIALLKPGGRVCVIAFHSLEDRIAKQTFQKYGQGCICPPDFPACACGRTPTVKVITKKPILPSDTEIAANPRARSAKLRIAEKL
ncbi:16S rRNA (cytosine(1402)-N(4))-methyltransferase RsmH [Bacillaceae bacterium]